MNIRRRVKITKGRFDIAPLIDVVFLLLIFFMLSSSFVLQPGIRVHLPQSSHSEMPIQEKYVLITMTTNGNIYLNDSIVSIDNLLKILLESQKKSVIIQADQEVRLQDLIRVWDVCSHAQIASINISTIQKKQ